MEKPCQIPSGPPVYTKLLAEAPMPTDRFGGRPLSFSRIQNGQSVPLKTTTLKEKHEELSGSSSSSETGSGSTSPSVASSPSSASQEDRLAAFEANIEESYLRKILTTPPFTSDKEQKSKIWYQALIMKKDAAQRLLHAQKIIQEIEDEVGQYLTNETIARLRSRYYTIDDESGPDGQFISHVSSVRVTSARVSI